LDPELASRGEGAPREERTHGAVGGIVPIATTSRHKPEFKKILIFSVRAGHFGLLKFRLEPEFLDTGFRYFLALNGRNFGANAHLAVNPAPHHQLKGLNPKGVRFK
jgi:hypothetical protein